MKIDSGWYTGVKIRDKVQFLDSNELNSRNKNVFVGGKPGRGKGFKLKIYSMDNHKEEKE